MPSVINWIISLSRFTTRSKIVRTGTTVVKTSLLDWAFKSSELVCQNCSINRVTKVKYIVNSIYAYFWAKFYQSSSIYPWTRFVLNISFLVLTASAFFTLMLSGVHLSGILKVDTVVWISVTSLNLLFFFSPCRSSYTW